MSNHQNNSKPSTTVSNPPAATDNVAATVTASAESVFKIGDKVTIRAVHGDLLHPYTDVRFTKTDEKRVTVDGWVKAQGDAGKLAVIAD